MSMNEQIEMASTVVITASDDAPADWLTRVTRDDFPYRHMDGSALSEREGLEHLAYNAVANGVEDASRLDGWSDLDRGVLTMRVLDIEVAQ